MLSPIPPMTSTKIFAWGAFRSDSVLEALRAHPETTRGPRVPVGSVGCVLVARRAFGTHSGDRVLRVRLGYVSSGQRWRLSCGPGTGCTQ